MKLFVLPEARQDQRDAIAWYSRQSPALSRRFLDELRSVMKRISETPQHFATFGSGNQRALLMVFPYSVIFHQMPDFIVIVAVAHTSRKPDYWNDRDIPDTL